MTAACSASRGRHIQDLRCSSCLAVLVPYVNARALIKLASCRYYLQQRRQRAGMQGARKNVLIMTLFFSMTSSTQSPHMPEVRNLRFHTGFVWCMTSDIRRFVGALEYRISVCIAC